MPMGTRDLGPRLLGGSSGWHTAVDARRWSIHCGEKGSEVGLEEF